MSSFRQTHGPSLFAGVLAMVLSWAIAGVLALGSGFLSLSFSTVIALSSFAAVLLVPWVRQRADGGSMIRPASRALLAWVPYVFIAAVFTLDTPIAVGHFRCGTGQMALLFLILLSLPVAFATAVALASALDRFPWHAFERVVACVALGVGVACLVASARRWHKPEPRDYVSSLPVVARLFSDADRFDGPAFSIAARAPSEIADGAPGCVVFVRGAEKEATSLAPDCAGVLVRRDAARDLWFVNAPRLVHGSVYAIDPPVGPAGPAGVEVGRVASSLRPPGEWTALLAAAVAVSLGLLLHAAKIRREARAWGAARAGVLGGGGWVTFEDGTPPVHLPAATSLPGGPILVIESSRTAPGYREHGRAAAGARFAAGDLEEVCRVADARAAGLHAFATLLTLVGLAPMLAAALAGLLG